MTQAEPSHNGLVTNIIISRWICFVISVFVLCVLIGCVCV